MSKLKSNYLKFVVYIMHIVKNISAKQAHIILTENILFYYINV